MAKLKINNYDSVYQDKRDHFPRKAREKSLINLEQIAVMEVIEGISDVEDEKTKTDHKKQRRKVKNCKRPVENLKSVKKVNAQVSRTDKECNFICSTERRDNVEPFTKKLINQVTPSKTNCLTHFMELGARTDLIDSHTTDPLGPDSFDNFQWVEVKQELPDEIEVCKITYTELPFKVDCHKATQFESDYVKEIIDIRLDNKEPNTLDQTQEHVPKVPFNKSKNDFLPRDIQELPVNPCDKEDEILEVSLSSNDNLTENSSDHENATDRLESENIEKIKMQKKRKSYPQECDICNKKLHSKGNLRNHKLKVHKFKIQFPCELCSLKFDFQREAIQHRNSVHRGEDGRFGCDMCSKRITDYYSYLTHIKSHADLCEGSAASMDCGRSLQKEGLSTHLTPELRGRLKIQDKNFTCDICGRKFAFSCLLQDHINTHTGVKPYLCQVCGKAFCQKATLKQHTKTHSEVRPYQCSECPHGFFSKGDFVKHQRRHTGERPYVCEVCGERFSRSTHLVVHRRTHTGERPHVCDICGRGFTKRGDLVRHRRVHTGELPYLCQVCGKAFRQSTQCANHIKSQHPDSPALVARNPNPISHRVPLQVFS